MAFKKKPVMANPVMDSGMMNDAQPMGMMDENDEPLMVSKPRKPAKPAGSKKKAAKKKPPKNFFWGQ